MVVLLYAALTVSSKSNCEVNQALVTRPSYLLVANWEGALLRFLLTDSTIIDPELNMTLTTIK